MQKYNDFKNIVKDLPTVIKIALVGMWAPIINLFSLIPGQVKWVLMLILFSWQCLLVRKMHQEIKVTVKLWDEECTKAKTKCGGA